MSERLEPQNSELNNPLDLLVEGLRISPLEVLNRSKVDILTDYEASEILEREGDLVLASKKILNLLEAFYENALQAAFKFRSSREEILEKERNLEAGLPPSQSKLKVYKNLGGVYKNLESAYEMRERFKIGDPHKLLEAMGMLLDEEYTPLVDKDSRFIQRCLNLKYFPSLSNMRRMARNYIGDKIRQNEKMPNRKLKSLQAQLIEKHVTILIERGILSFDKDSDLVDILTAPK